MSTFLHHVFPPFDAWWPNIVAAVIWATPAFAVHHIAIRKHVTKTIRREMNRGDHDGSDS